MSAAQTSAEFVVFRTRSSRHLPFPYSVLRLWDEQRDERDPVADDARLVDQFRTASGAEYAARMLNSDLATINPHAVVGCRVEVK